MPVTDILGAILTGLQFGLSALQFTTFIQLIMGGWVTILRSIGFFIDKTLISIITKGFEYFELIISKELFAPSLINTITKNVYFFIAVFVLFKLVIRFMKFIIEPDLISDKNIGTNAIVKRTVIGMCLILFIPSIFGIIRDFQKAIIADDIVNNLIMDTTTKIKYEEVKNRAPVGRIIGYSVLRGFLNYDDEKFAASLVKKTWEQAENNFDASGISINAGGIGYVDNYYYDYIPIISTIALGYTAWLIIKYCFDVLVRFLKLTILQIISPIVMVDYIFDGGEQGTFKQWTTTVISTFAMLFIRILSLSFVIMVCVHMQMSKQDCLDKYVDSAASSEVQNEDRIACENSLLYIDDDGDVDNLLRAAVIIALLAFSMDLPKLFSQIFGLDLEQESSVTRMVQKVGGIGKMVGIAGLAIGGGLLGGAIGNAKAAIGGAQKMKSLRGQTNALNSQAADLSNRFASGSISRDEYNSQMSKINAQRSAVNAQKKKAASDTLKQSTASSAKAFGAIVAQTPLRGAVSSFNESYGAQKAEQAKQREKEKAEQAEADTKAYRKHLMDHAAAQTEELTNYNINQGGKAQSDRAKAKIDAMTDFSVENDTVIGKLGKISSTSELINENVVNIKDDTKVIRDNSAVSLVNQGIANQKLDNLNTTSQVTAENVVKMKEDTKVIRDNSSNSIDLQAEANKKLDNISTSSHITAEHTVNIDKKMNTVVNQTEHISHKVDQIEDNTFYSGIESINNMENSGYIDKPIKSLNDNTNTNTPKTTIKKNNDDIETL